MQDQSFSKFPLTRRCVATAGVVLCLAATPAQAKFGDLLYKLTPSDPYVGGGFGHTVGISGDLAYVGQNFNPPNGGEVRQNPGVAYLFDTMTGQEVQRLTPSDEAPGETWVAISGNIALSGNAGSAYLFDTTTGQELWKLTPSDQAPFGPRVAISGNIAVVGKWGNPYTGFAYLFDVTTGQELFKLTASDVVEGDFFGSRVAISGSTAIVGAANRDDAGLGSGAAYLFDTTTGQELRKLTASDAAALDTFGSDVGMSGNTAIVGANGKDDAGNRSGAAYLFDVATGQELFKLTASDAAAGDSFGTSVAISGNTAIVGGVGKAYLFDVTTGQELMKLTPDPVSVSVEVAIDGDTAIVGNRSSGYGGSPSTRGPGAAYVFDVSRGPALPGDFNNDSTVDAADYIVWRNGLGTTYTQSDYNTWRANFGHSAAGAVAVADSFANVGSANIPEPTGVALLASASITGLLCQKRHRRRLHGINVIVSAKSTGSPAYAISTRHSTIAGTD
jgi:hypothetical protein